MKGKIVSLAVVLLIVFGSFSAIGLNHPRINENIKVPKQNTSSIKNIEIRESNYYNYKYSLGLLDDPYNLFDYEDKTIVSGEPPESWDWRDATYNGETGNWVTPVRDQGSCGSCYAFATVASLESAYKISENNPNLDVDFSEQFLVSCGEEWIGNQNLYVRLLGCQGGTILGALEFLKKFGSINETCFPYTSGMNGDEPSCDEKCQDYREQIIRPKSYKLIQGEPIRTGIFISDWDPTNIKNALVKYGPLASMMFVFEDFFNYTSGIYALDRTKEFRLLGGHMVLIVGYQDDTNIDTGGYWICKNSWGPDWGENGYFKVKYDDFYIWYYEEYFNRLKSIRSLQDLFDFMLWCNEMLLNFPSVGIGFFPCSCFTGILTKSINPKSNDYTLFEN